MSRPEGSGNRAAEDSTERKKLREFDLGAEVIEALDKFGIETCTPIQEKVIPPILEGHDVVGKAETGTGKTIGFGAPLVGKVDTGRVAVQGLVLTPTRELAQQVAEVLRELGSTRENLRVSLLVGGVHASEQIPKLREGSQIAVGTPGRVLDFLKQGILSLGWCETVVLDEADRMLDMGFIDEVGAILDRIPTERQTLLFSATLPQGVSKILKRYMNNPRSFSTSKGLSTVPDIQQSYVTVGLPRKFNELRKVLDKHPDDTAIVFCNTRRQAIDLDRMLWGHGYSAGALHGDQEQDVRFRVMESFRGSDIKVLVATDVASRGLDIEAVNRVINYDVPDEVEAYVHRIGRTGRANKNGIAITFVSPKERRQWEQVVKETGFNIDRSGAGERSSRGDNRGRGDESAGRGDRSQRRRQGGRRGRNSRERSDQVTSSDGASSGSDAADRGRGAAAGVRGDSRRGGDPEPGSSRQRRKGGAPSAADSSQRSASGGSGRRRSGGRQRKSKPAPVETSPESKEAIEYWESQDHPGRRPPDRPTKLTLEDVDDTYLKTDYFDVDDDVLARVDRKRRPGRTAPPERSSADEASSSREGKSGEGKSGEGKSGEGKSGEGGTRSRRRGRGGGSQRRPRGEGSGTRGSGTRGSGTRGSGTRGSGTRDSGTRDSGSSEDAQERGGRRRRSRRRRRGGGSGGGGSAD